MAVLTLWRLSHERYADSAFSGEGARTYGGRFNSPGTAVVYTSDHLALALLETLTGLERYDQLYDYVFFQAPLPDKHVSEIAASDLPDNWNDHPPSPETQRLGDRWIRHERSLGLRVPSVVVPYSHNVLLNPEHPAFEELEISSPESLPVDRRLIPRSE